MNKGILVAVIAVIILIFGGVILLGRNTETETNQTQSPTDNTTATTESETGDAMMEQSNHDVQLDTENSVVTWHGEFQTGLKEENGTVSLKSGGIDVDESGAITGGSFVIDMNTIEDNNGSQQLVTHLKSDDFFSVQTFPESMFVITTVQNTGGTSYTVAGDLTIKGITNPISFPATITETDGVYSAQGSVTIDRSLWDIRYNSESFFSDLGDSVIVDDIDLTFDLVTLPSDAMMMEEDGAMMEDDTDAMMEADGDAMTQ